MQDNLVERNVIYIETIKRLECVYLLINFYQHIRKTNPNYKVLLVKNIEPLLHKEDFIRQILEKKRTVRYRTLLDGTCIKLSDDEKKEVDDIIANSSFSVLFQPFDCDTFQFEITMLKFQDACICELRMKSGNFVFDDTRPAYFLPTDNFYIRNGKIDILFQMQKQSESEDYRYIMDDVDFYYKQLRDLMIKMIRFGIGFK
jgi:hypothetical protein